MFKDRGSSFIAYTARVEDTEEVEQKLEEWRSIHPKARHLCYAYLIDEQRGLYRANDDGEPSGSAGLPILNQIKSFCLTHVLVGVIRYFGGTKLGVSGLINAYKSSTREALEASVVIEDYPKVEIRIPFDYALMEAVMSFIKKMEARVLNQEYSENCILTVRLAESELEEYEQYFNSLDIRIEK